MKHFILVFLLFSSSYTFSQSLTIGSLISDFNRNGQIEGLILDGENNNEPLMFADVIVKGTSISEQTAKDGSFKLHLKPGNYSLVFNFIGYKSVELKNVEVTSNNTLKLNQVLNALKFEMHFSEQHVISKGK